LQIFAKHFSSAGLGFRECFVCFVVLREILLENDQKTLEKIRTFKDFVQNNKRIFS
jgi:hypothetical protein